MMHWRHAPCASSPWQCAVLARGSFRWPRSGRLKVRLALYQKSSRCVQSLRQPTPAARRKSARAKRVQMPAPTVTPEEARVQLQCPICLEGIWPCETVKESFCHPIHHVTHWNCWWDQTDEQQERCSICRQSELSRPNAFMIYNHFPARGLQLSFQDLCGEPSMRWFTPAGQGLVQDFVRGELTEEVLIRMARAAPRRPNVDNAINSFINTSCKKRRT